MALVPHFLRPGSCKPVSLGLGQGACSTRTAVVRTSIICSSVSAQGRGALESEETRPTPQIGVGNGSDGSEPTVSNRNQSLREQLQLLNLESLRSRVLGSPQAARKADNGNGDIASRNRSTQRDSRTSSFSSSAGEVLALLKGATESEEGAVLALEGWNGSLSPRDVVIILNALDSWKMALSLFKWLQVQASSSLNVFTYNVMLKVLRRGRQWRTAEDIAIDMIRAGIMPDNYTYSTIISCANRCNHQEDALKWFDRMHEAGCKPDEVTFSSMIDVYGKCGRFDEAVALYEQLREGGWKPDRVTLGTMVKIYGRAGNSRQAVLVFREMKDSGIQPDSVVYNTLISLLGRLGRMTHAMKIFEEMERSGVQPTAVTLSTVIETYSRAGNTEEALRIFDRLKKNGVVCDAIVYNTMIKMCGESGLVTEADQFLREMIEAGCQPNDWTYKTMTNLFAKRGMFVEAERMFSSLLEAGYEADVMAYTCLLRAYGVAKDYKTFLEIFDKMVKANINLDERLCGVVLNLLTLCDTHEDRKLLRGCLRQGNPMLDKIVGHIFEEELPIDSLRKDFQCMLSQVPEDAHKPFCNSLLDLSWNGGCRNHAFQILSLLSTLGVYPGLQSKSSILWCLHLRSLSGSAAHCALLSWISSVNIAVQEGQELPNRLIIETGAGRQRGSDEPRLNAVISSILKEINSPFKECLDRKDWLEASGVDVRSWLETEKLELPMDIQVTI